MAPFNCIKCGKCCLNTEMPLTGEDVARLKSLGYDPEDFTILKDGLTKLRNIDGHCFFLEPISRRCKVYEYRPEGCRMYPFIYINGEGVVVDQECSAAYTASLDDVAKVAPKLLNLLQKLGLSKEARDLAELLRQGACLKH